ncbi:unnamed protein product [Cylindrotheca closterium]|uniref:Uncharacterized protein n=1 Tax=Cylindrotheca closterium TaxID=2856 RepID=A0AAD2FEF6_9STRA|nr:unnamed protein product [Cylindrotheca closterium]
MENFMSRLMSDYSVTDFVIIRDDATIGEHQRAEFNAIATLSQHHEEASQRPSFSNPQSSASNNDAPTLPSRKESFDDLSMASTPKGGSRRKRSLLNDEMLLRGIKRIGSKNSQAFLK